ncbi:MAG: cytochrome c oxidase subunit II [Caldilineaceae bacterium]
MLNLLPEQASTFAAEIDRIYLVLTVLSLIFAVPIAGLIVYFGVRDRRGANVDRTGALTESTRLELSWITILVILSMAVYVWGSTLYVRMYAMPADALDIYVLGRQWMWQMQYPTGQREINVLNVPVGRPVRLTMISQDVIHSFYVPAFRTKHDVVPGRYSVMWFEATKPGEYDLFCAEYCGTEHSGMVGKVIALEPRQYEEWLRTHAVGGVDAIPEHAVASSQAPQTMAQVGEQLFVNLGCNTCHLPTGRGIGPALVGLFGSEVELESGETLVADAQYIRRSILDPRSQIVAGYPSVMPTYEGQIDEQELFSLVEYIRSLNTPTDTIQPQDSNPANATGAANTPGGGPEAGEPGEQPADTGDVEIESGLRGDQPDAADNTPTGAEPDENN